MKKSLLLVLLLSIIFHSTFTIAQSAYKNARIVTIQNDTLNGFINDRQELKNPSIIFFKEKINSKEQSYAPAQIKAAIIDSGDYYESAFIHVDRNYAITGDIAHVYSKDENRKDTLFLRLLVKTDLSLYIFVDENEKKHFYIKDETGNCRELIYKKMPVNDSNNRNYLETISRYKEQLKILMKSCSDALSQIDKTEYTESDLLKLFYTYSKCTSNDKTQYISSVKIKRTIFHLVAGVDITNINFVGESGSYLEKSIFSKSIRPAFGIRAVIPLDRNRGKYSLVPELFFHQYDTKSHLHGESFTDYDVHFQMDYLRLNLALEYKYLAPKVQPYFNAGLSFAYLVNSINTVHTTYNDPYLLSFYPRETDEIAIKDPYSIDIGYFGSAGIQIKRFSAEIRYERMQGFCNVALMNAPVETFYFLVAYKLNAFE